MNGSAHQRNMATPDAYVPHVNGGGELGAAVYRLRFADGRAWVAEEEHSIPATDAPITGISSDAFGAIYAAVAGRCPLMAFDNAGARTGRKGGQLSCVVDAEASWGPGRIDAGVLAVAGGHLQVVYAFEKDTTYLRFWPSEGKAWNALPFQMTALASTERFICVLRFIDGPELVMYEYRSVP